MKKKITEVEIKGGSAGVISLVTGIMGLLTLPIVFSTLGVIFGAIGMNKGLKYAKAGFVCGIIGWLYGFYKFVSVLIDFGLL